MSWGDKLLQSVDYVTCKFWYTQIWNESRETSVSRTRLTGALQCEERLTGDTQMLNNLTKILPCAQTTLFGALCWPLKLWQLSICQRSTTSAALRLLVAQDELKLSKAFFFVCHSAGIKIKPRMLSATNQWHTISFLQSVKVLLLSPLKLHITWTATNCCEGVN